MTLKLRIAAVAVSALVLAISDVGTASAQKRGGTLRIYNPESIASLSMLEEFANAELPIMGMFNNLIMFDQHVAENSLQSIVPDLATSWLWDEEGTGLTFKLRQVSNGMTESRSPPMTSCSTGNTRPIRRPRR